MRRPWLPVVVLVLALLAALWPRSPSPAAG